MEKREPIPLLGFPDERQLGDNCYMCEPFPEKLRVYVRRSGRGLLVEAVRFLPGTFMPSRLMAVRFVDSLFDAACVVHHFINVYQERYAHGHD